MGVRRRGREYALQMLYAMDLTAYEPDEVFAGFNAIQDLNRDAFYYARRGGDAFRSSCHSEPLRRELEDPPHGRS